MISRPGQKFSLMLLLLFSGQHVFAAQQEAGSPLFSQIVQIIGALLFVICLIIFLSILIRKNNLIPATESGVIKIIASTSISNSEKLLLVEIGNEQVLLGQSNNGLCKLLRLNEKVGVPDQLQRTSGFNFQQLLATHLGKGGKPAGEHNA